MATRNLEVARPIVRRNARPVVVTALALATPARDHLARQLGDVDVRDVRDDVLEADLVLAPSCSPRAISALKGAYPSARLVVVELDDWDFNVRFAGPVKRVLDAGADAYVTADSIEQLARQLRPRAQEGAVAGEATALDERDLSVDDVIMANVADALKRRLEASRSDAAPGGGGPLSPP